AYEANAALAIAPHNADNAKRWRTLMMSGRFSTALSNVPATKPSWTAIVSHPAVESESCHSERNAGRTAHPLKQSDIAGSSATDNKLRRRQRPDGGASIATEVKVMGWSAYYKSKRPVLQPAVSTSALTQRLGHCFFRTWFGLGSGLRAQLLGSLVFIHSFVCDREQVFNGLVLILDKLRYADAD